MKRRDGDIMTAGGIRLDGVTKHFGDTVAVRDVSLTVEQGELVVLVGPSGCGKTTLLRLIAGLETPTHGDVYIDGERITDVPARHRDIALVFQDDALFPHLDVRENLGFNLRMQGYSDIDDRVSEVAELLDVGALLDRDVDELSGGQRQRVALGRAIVSEPQAFLLDEPLANLDARLRERMQTEIARLQDRIGITTVHVTHDQGEAMTMGDRIAVLDDGAIQQVGPPETVYAEPATLFAARFVGSPAMNLLPGTYHPEREAITVGVDGDTGALAIPVGLVDDDVQDVHVGIRPEAVVVGEPAGKNAHAPPSGVAATVAYSEFRGADRYLYLQVDDLPELVARVDAGTDLADGAAVRLGFPPDRLHVFGAESGTRLSISD